MNEEIRAFDVCDYKWRRCINSSMKAKCINAANVEQEDKSPSELEYKTFAIMIDLMGTSLRGNFICFAFFFPNFYFIDCVFYCNFV